MNIFTAKASLLMTNVPGPPVRIHIAGRELSSVVVWAPVSGALSLGCSLISYGGFVRSGVPPTCGWCPIPDAIVRAFEREIMAQRESMA